MTTTPTPEASVPMSGVGEGGLAEAREVSADYVAGLRFAADVAHAEARWQTELAMRHGAGASYRLAGDPTQHTYAAERAAKVEAAIRAVAEAVTPTAALSALPVTPEASEGAGEVGHTCCACFTHNGLPCCNEGHPRELTIQHAWLTGQVRAVPAYPEDTTPTQPESVEVRREEGQAP